MTTRPTRLAGRLDDLGAGAFLVTTPVNVEYLVGFRSSSAALLVTHESLILFTDGRYIESASRLEGVEAVLVERGLAVELGERLAAHTAGPVAFEAGRVTVADHHRISSCGLELVPTEREVERFRVVKDSHELATIRRSAAVLGEGFEALASRKLTGRTEVEVARCLDEILRDLGADGPAFETIVAAGANAALPHHRPGELVIEPGELVLIDAGCIVDRYASDCTRTLATGPLSAELRHAYDACLQVQEDCVAAVTAGTPGKVLDERHRSRLGDAGYRPLHGLGHGVGLEVHEGPRLSRLSDDVLPESSVVTVEPGVYLPGTGGVRIEDLVIVTNGTPEILTRTEKELRTVS